ncbi:PREDICTED: protein lap1 isoform X1 [Polistes canadensis]|uniref:protein lap1 isoform X1 n=1 Tax=Polistes canadensis TaxID=91411 RepID=UPI000718DD15|nr:PREDICTED: protein lap1 isoform X1 [Polistes canadensis]XP_014609033.1 PREDICTED: protein lap1 isoform X1 [Polistes canadensis]
MGSAWWQCAACLRAQEEDICELQLNHCNLYDVPPDVFIYERTLEKLYLDANRIKDLPRPLFQCHELRILSLSDNEVTVLPPAIASLINLEYLDLSKNTIKELPDSIKECKNLRSIDISVNPFERFPDAITHIVGLRELYINDAYIEYLPANFGRLSALKTLELRENNLMTLPKSMSRLVNLQRLDIGNNDFTELPEVVGDLINLTELWIDGNDIRRISPNIEQLYRLNHFDCTMNAVHLIPSEIRGWRDISIMNLSSNEIYQLPDTLCYLRTIVTLKIDDNQLNALPNDIGQMSSLEELIVTKNFLEYLPSSIGLLRKLHCLNADNNYLRCLPPEIGSCTALSLLSLRSNNLTCIPPEVGHLSSLRVLNLVNNCIKFLPVSMLNLTNLKALWLSDNQSQPLVPLQQEFNCEEDMMVLSCFMLPQKQRQDLEQMAQAVGPISSSIIGTGKRICFAAEVESEVPNQLHRAPTPYPKELRNLARHARNLHHQTTHDQKMNLEQQTMIKEAIITKATTTLENASKSGTSFSQGFTNKSLSLSVSTIDHLPKDCKINSSVRSIIHQDKEHSNSEESSDEANKTVLAKEKSPDIREAKYIRNPSSDYIAKTPTVADYVNSTWMPDEYSKANIAKIVDSDKFIEPFNNTSLIIDGKSYDQVRSNEFPPVPPPYHIAAAFSKKAALFQQFNNILQPENYLTNLQNTSNMSNVDDIQRSNGNVEPVKIEELVNAAMKNPTFDGKETNNGSINNGKKLLLNTNDLVSSSETTTTNLDQTIETDRFFKPSKIPVPRAKHSDIVNSNSNNDTLNKSVNSIMEECDLPRTLNVLSIPTSPITGKKYRSPLSSQEKTLNQLKKIANSNISNNNISYDNTNLSNIQNISFTDNKIENMVKNETNTNDISHHSDSFATNCVDVENDAGSDRSTSLSASNRSLNNTNNLDKVHNLSNEQLTLERRPRFKWMFGPHKNANVLPVQVRKNPGLGFSIAGGVAGAETGIIVTKVNPDGPAQGTLRPGDKILEVDGIDFTKSDHNNAVAVLRATGAVVSMMISRHQ